MLLSNMVLYCIFCNSRHDENLMQQVNTGKDFLPEVTELENLVENSEYISCCSEIPHYLFDLSKF